LHGPQRYAQRCLKSFGGGVRNSLSGRSWKGVADEFDGFTRHIGEARSKTRVFKGLNSSFQGGRIFWCHAGKASTLFVLSHSASFDQRRRPEALRTAIATAFFCPTMTTSRLPLVTAV
jgi:hypothetical protein